MSNMSYCRFQNTKNDLEECADHINDDNLSQDEFDARKRLVELCEQIISDFSDPEFNEEDENEDDECQYCGNFNDDCTCERCEDCGCKIDDCECNYFLDE